MSNFTACAVSFAIGMFVGFVFTVLSGILGF